MCGRFRLTFSDRDYLWRFFGLDLEYYDEIPDGIDLECRPTNNLPIIRRRDNKNIVESLRWGFIESFLIQQAKTGDGKPVFNATCEKLSSSPPFKGAFMNGQRCIVPAREFYEWPVQNGEKVKTIISLASGNPLLLAGLYKTCKNRAGEAVQCFTIITCPPNEFMAPIHNRMPVILTEERAHDWLSIDTPSEDLLKMLVPYSGTMNAAGEQASLF